MSLNQWFLQAILPSGTLAILLMPVTARASSPPFFIAETLVLETIELDPHVSQTQAQTLTISSDLSESFVETSSPNQVPVASPQSLDLPVSEQPTQDDGVQSMAQHLTPLKSEAALHEVAAPWPQVGLTLAQIRPANTSDEWEFVLEPYLFVPFSVTTDISVAGITQSISVGLGDLFNLDSIFSGALRFEARNPQYGFFADVSHIRVREGRAITGYPVPPALANLVNQRTPITIPPGTPLDVAVTATGRTTTINLGGYYRVVDQYLGTTSTNEPTYPRLLFDPYLGLRIVVLSGSLDFGVGLGNLVLEDLVLDESATLLKPLLGAQLGLELSDQWSLGLRGDISGFNIGAAENLAWSVWAGARYRFAPSVALQLAYQYKESRYRGGQGITQFSLDQSQHGVWLGFDIGL